MFLSVSCLNITRACLAVMWFLIKYNLSLLPRIYHSSTRTPRRNQWFLLTYLFRKPTFRRKGAGFNFEGTCNSQCFVCLLDYVEESGTFACIPLSSTCVTMQTWKVEQIFNGSWNTTGFSWHHWILLTEPTEPTWQAWCLNRCLFFLALSPVQWVSACLLSWGENEMRWDSPLLKSGLST